MLFFTQSQLNESFLDNRGRQGLFLFPLSAAYDMNSFPLEPKHRIFHGIFKAYAMCCARQVFFYLKVESVSLVKCSLRGAYKTVEKTWTNETRAGFHGT